MIDHVARREARAISTGATLSERADDKIVIYGLTTLALASVELGNTLTLDHTLSDFSDLEGALKDHLSETAGKGYNNLSRLDKGILELMYSKRIPSMKDRTGDSPAMGLTRMVQGCGTAARTEIMTLRTIAKMQIEGAQISTEGIYASYKVPFSVAMVHLQDFLQSRDEEEWWSRSEGGDGGPVFRPQDVRLDPQSGLSFVGDWEVASISERQPRGPQVGCPATLVKDYIKNLHIMATTAALEAGLVRPST